MLCNSSSRNLDSFRTGFYIAKDSFSHGHSTFAANILAVEKLRDQVTPHLLVSELRTIDADDLWISPCYRRPSMTIHFTWKPEWPAVRNLLTLIEERLAPFDVKPHWAKLFTVPPARLNALYPKMPAYRELLRQYDPQGKFRNEFLDANIFAG